MLIKLQSILHENGGVGSTCQAVSRSGFSKFSSASINKLHEEFSKKMRYSIRNLSRINKAGEEIKTYREEQNSATKTPKMF